MNNFSYYNATKIHFGKDQIARINEEISHDARVLITYGGGSIKTNGVFEQVVAALNGRTIFEFGGIEPNPHLETLSKAVDLARNKQVTHVLAVGGGSVIDGSKFIAAGALYPNDLWEIIETNGKYITQALPLGCVLTLAATGSEMNKGASITRAETKDKLFFGSVHVFPKFSILDPTTTYSLPVRQVGNGVIDAFAHVVEQYITYPINAPIQDRIAEGLLITLIEEGPKALQNPLDYDVRANLMLAATIALNGTLAMGVPTDWASHMIGLELTGLYGLDHAQTLAILIPAVWYFKKEQKKAKLLQYGERVWGLVDGNDEDRAVAAIEKTRSFFMQMGLPTKLCDYGLDHSVIPTILAKLEQHGLTKLGEYKDITPADVKNILELAL